MTGKNIIIKKDAYTSSHYGENDNSKTSSEACHFQQIEESMKFYWTVM